MSRKRMILRDNIQGITKPSIKRLSLLAGCEMISADSYENIRGILLEKMDECLSKAVIFMEHDKRKTLLYKDLARAVEQLGGKLYGDETVVYDICKTSAELVKYQGNCVTIAKASFTRLTKEILQNYGTFNLSKPFKENFQYYTEKQIINVFSSACQLAMEMGKRKTVKGSDLQSVYKHTCSPTAVRKITIPKKRKPKTTKKPKALPKATSPKPKKKSKTTKSKKSKTTKSPKLKRKQFIKKK